MKVYLALAFMKKIINVRQLNMTAFVPFLEGTTVDLTDGDSNEVYAVDNKYIVKKYFSQKQLQQETSGYLLFNALTSFGVPMVLDKGNDYLVLEFVNADSCFKLFHTIRTLTMQQAAQKAALFIAEVYWNYRFIAKDKIKLFRGISWEERSVEILTKSLNNLSVIKGLLTSDQLKLVKDAQTEMKTLEVTGKSLSLLHRDLHLDNILVKKDVFGRNGNYVIDFEHCMEGPIELEMQNSIFWNDDWSISSDMIREELIRKHDIPYSLEQEGRLLCVYFLDQLNIALEKRDTGKVQLLVNTYDQRMQERNC